MLIKTEYIHHSCYTLEIEDCFFVFDYFEGNLKIPNNKKIYFFVTHTHGDHFSLKIFDYSDVVEKYIISSDVKVQIDNKIKSKVVYVEENQEIEVDMMKIKTYTSTDAGVAFMINTFEKNIFFAGDLNDWYWEMEDSLEAKEAMHLRFRNEIDKMVGIKIDIAYFLVDPRQASQFDLGGKQILELKPRYFLPLHFWENFDITTKFKQKYENTYKETKIFDLKSRNQILEFDI